MGTFAARYESQCPECDAWIDAGEPIGYVDDVVVCSDCYEDSDEAQSARED